MKSIDLHNAEVGTISSRQDGSVTVRFTTAELRPSEAGALIQYHGKAARIAIFPHEGEPEEKIDVKTERDQKTPSQRLRSVIFLWWKQEGQEGSFNDFYDRKIELMIDGVKKKLDA